MRPGAGLDGPNDLTDDALPKPPAKTPAVRAPLPMFTLGQASVLPKITHALPASPADRLRGQHVAMDHKTHRKMTRGKLAPDARIDLHGMTLAVAKSQLTGFIMGAHAQGHRLVLVITGKGKGDMGPLPTRSGALRHEVPHWLAMAPLTGSVLQVVPAHIRHGGAGAYYVYLRRGRSR